VSFIGFSFFFPLIFVVEYCNFIDPNLSNLFVRTQEWAKFY
jgi:hypothetical protein